MREIARSHTQTLRPVDKCLADVFDLEDRRGLDIIPI